MALTKAPKTVSGSLYGYANQYTPYKAPAVIKPKPVIPYLSGGAGGLASNPIFSSNAALNASLKPQPSAVPNTTQITNTARSYRPDFKGWIQQNVPGDWEVQDAEAAMGTRMDQLRAALGLDINEAMVNLGLPSDERVQGEFGSYITPETIQKAIGNKYSTAAQIADQAFKARKQTQAALAARGMLRSGATTNAMGTIAGEAERGRYEAIQQFLSGARGGVRGLGEAKTEMEGKIASARSAAAQRLAQQYGYTYPDEYTETTTTETVPVTTAPPVSAPARETAAQRQARLAEEALARRSAAMNAYYRSRGMM